MMSTTPIRCSAPAFAGRQRCARTAFARSRVSTAATGRLSMYPDELCQVSYSSSGTPDSMHRATMPAAARSAFKALERDSLAAMARSRVAPSATAAASPPAQSAIDTLCLVTYSEDEEAASASWQQQQQHVKSLFTSSIVSAAAAATAKAHPAKAAAIFAALCSEDHTDEDDQSPEVMETLCMLSYDEESA